ncbi:GLPGLI family protein [uncultured Alistipes sp.]|jgi:GLPGLI family protein|uniref:GLPGLI family protein n=1 Tax=uncultured Alistipes sp. TaxID=538949 RepID=UPI0025ECFCE2|nr:GLPGLI family protein [uncultured Alistipes sp.]
MKKAIILLAVALTAFAAGRAQTIVTFSTDGGAQAFNTAEVQQTVIDTATLEVSYRMEWLRRPDSEKPTEDLMLLQAGGKTSKFFSYKTLQRDSLLRVTPSEQVLANPGNFKGGVQYAVFQNYPQGELTCTDKIATDYLLYTEPLPEIGWELSPRTREIIGYTCRRATCTFRGRDYEAWYTEEIPLGLGPWKFRGLPGLILAVNDLADPQGIIRFEATGIRKSRTPVTMADLNYLKTSRKKFRSTEQKFMTDPIGYMSANSGVKITVQNPDGTPREGADLIRQYNPLELE